MLMNASSCCLAVQQQLPLLTCNFAGAQGVSNKQSICQTCGQKLQDCTGHFGTFLLLNLSSC